MKMNDKIQLGTDQAVKENLDKIVRLIIDQAQQIAPDDKDDVVSEIIRRTSLYAALQLRMMIDLYDHPIECIAWISRNLFEMNLIIEYSLKFPDKAKDFGLQKGSDEKEILEGVLSLDAGGSRDNVITLQERISHINNVLKKYGKNDSKHFPVKGMADQVGMEDDYNAFFKLYSKYVHPTSWLIFATEEEKANETYKNTFLIQAQYYSSRILKICEDYKKKNANKSLQ